MGKYWNLAKTASLVLGLLILVSVACDTHEPVRKSTVAQALTGNPNVQRFILVNNNLIPAGFLAMDTQTGRLCRTWDWSTPGNSPLAGKGIDSLDTCREMLGHDDLWLIH
jgi:hypothetical protein